MNKTLHIVALCSLSAVLGVKAEEKTLASLQGKNLKIGFVDTFKVMQDCESGKKVTKEIKEHQEALAKDLQEKQQKYAKAMGDFQAKGAALSADAREKEEKKIMSMRRDLEKDAQEYEEDLKREMQKATEEVAMKVDKGVIETAQAEGFDAMVCKVTGRVIYTKPEFDMTEVVTKQVDKKSPKAPAAATKVTQSSVPAKAKNS